MEIFVPNSAHLNNLENFLRRLDFGDPSRLTLSFHPKWISVHPVVLSTVSAIGLEARRNGISPEAILPKIPGVLYFDRMGVFRLLDIETGRVQTSMSRLGDLSQQLR